MAVSGKVDRSADWRRAALFAWALFPLIAALRFVVDDPIEAVGFLYVIPISVIAAEYGSRAGLAAAGAAVALTVLWAIIEDVPLGPLGYGSRATAFAVIGWVVGAQATHRHVLERERAKLVAALREMAMRDELTGLANRRAWDDRLAQETLAANRYGHPLAVAVIDLDTLKETNDTHGHQRGDEAIRTCAATLSDAVRDSDFIARVGGDEFLALFPGTDAASAEEALTRALAALPSGQSYSAGVADRDGTDFTADLVGRADEALYAAKRAGGGRVQSAPHHTA